ncbi:MAG: aminopeptidase, partial [Bacteroidota bacterium]
MRPYLCSLLLLLSTAAFGQKGNTNELPPKVLKRIDALFKDYADLNTPGYAVGISQDNTTLLQKGYGAANLDYNLPITP